MLTKISRFASSFAALLSDGNTVIDVDGRFANIQQAMLAALWERVSEEPVFPKIYFDINRAAEIQTLWYLRSDLFSVLSGYCGEQIAHAKLDEITEMFRGLIPKNQLSNRRREPR
jgi:hypothetical protein